MTLVLGMIGPDVQAIAEVDGWWLRPLPGVEADLASAITWPASTKTSVEGKTAALQAEMLLGLEIAESVGGALVIRWEQFGQLRQEEVGLPLRWTEWSPLMLTIDRVSEIGRPDFRYRYRYRMGASETAVDRFGYFVRRRATGDIYHLDEQTYALVDAMDRFNAGGPDERSRERAWLSFAEIKGCSEAVGAALDRHLASNDVVVPSHLALDVFEHEDGSISFVPKVSGLPEGQFQAAFLRNTAVQGLYDLDGEGGRRVRVVLTVRQQEVLERMRQVRRARGKTRDEARRNPAQFFDGLLDAIEIEYGPRVIGIGDFPFASLPHNPTEGGGFFGEVPTDESPAGAAGQGERDRPTSVTVPGRDGGDDIKITFQNRRELDEARATVAEAHASGAATVEIQGVTVPVTSDLVTVLEQPPVMAGAGKGRKYLLIYTDEEDVRPADTVAARRASDIPANWPENPVLPKSLWPEAQLKAHQLESLLWLQRCEVITSRKGVLLADDMGLGKTLQILTYLAGRIERGCLQADPETPGDGPPWRPILIVAPLILVENETWVSEMRRFFLHDGNIFDPILVLRGSGIDQVRTEGARGSETVIGRPVLDAAKLMQYRVIITNYETIVNYQHSLAQLQDGRPIWSAVVTDEAQKYKALNTKISVALKAIATDFHIASTGTPVENRLLDLWNIMDTLQPALLGTASEFSATFERPLGKEDGEDTLEELRQKLLFGEPHAFLIRRTKDQLLDLPKKTEQPIYCEMSPAEKAAHAELLSVLGRERQAGRHLAVLQKLARLYQHPALLTNDWEERPVENLIAESTKLQAVLRELHRIRGRAEKAIIFARHLDAQQILARVIGEEFSTHVPVINGSTSRGQGFKSSSGATARTRNERKRILDDFRERPGFGVLILSPFVAGIGLTITEANHVIHYGRWWNPAVEAQATDRAYRIGQDKEVTVYLPILRDSSKEHIKESFDECLDRLLRRKNDLARDFLHPAEQEGLNAAELCELLESQADTVGADKEPFTAEDLDRLGPYEFEAAVAVLLEAEGYETILTPKGNDGGADVLAIGRVDNLVVQAKHSGTGTPTDERALNDVLAASDFFTSQVEAHWRALVVSNAPFTPEAIREAQHLGIDLLSGRELTARMARGKVGWVDAATRESMRASSLGEAIRSARSRVSVSV